MRVSLLAILLMSLSGCGGSGSSNSAPPQVQSGNWNLSAVDGGYGSYIGGAVSNSNGSLTGTLHILASSPCFNVMTDVHVTGSANSDGTASITSSAFNGQVIAASFHVFNEGASMNGTYTITGGCADGQQGSITANIVPNISGSWAGSILSGSTGTTQQISGTITQSTTANADGFYPISGTVSFPGSTCFSSGTIQDGLSAGGIFSFNIATSNGTVSVIGALADMSAASSMAIQYSVSGGTCSGDTGTGTLTHS